MKQHKVAIPRATLAWLIDVAEGAYSNNGGLLDRQMEVNFRVHVSIAHEALGTLGTIVPEPRRTR